MLDAVPALLPDLRSLYEDLHAHPELSFQEHRTAGILADRLRALGYEVAVEVGRTGVVAVLRNGDGPTVLLRADIDALPVRETTGLPYASTATGIDPDGATVPVAHACGHDMHATWMVGVAAVLAERRADWSGTALVVFQPAEEIGSGAEAMVDDGLFERFGTPVVALGQHVAPAPAGMVFTRAGTMMAGSDALKVVLHGRGGHGSTPHRTVDPAVMASSTVLALQRVVAREVDPAATAVVTVGTMRVGTKENVIADQAELTVNVRTFEADVRQRVMDSIRRIIDGEAEVAGAPVPPDVSSMYEFPPLANDADATARVVEALTAHFGPGRVHEAPMVTGSEDFGTFGTRGGFPSVFWFVGGTDAEQYLAALSAGRVDEDVPYNHAPDFAPVQDPTLSTGIEAMLTAARCWLGPGS